MILINTEAYSAIEYFKMKIFFIALVVVQLCNGIQSSLETNSLKPFKEYIQETKSYLISNCSSDFILSVESNFYDETSPLKGNLNEGEH